MKKPYLMDVFVCVDPYQGDGPGHPPELRKRERVRLGPSPDGFPWVCVYELDGTPILYSDGSGTCETGFWRFRIEKQA